MACTSPRSAAKTPIWQVIEDSTRTIVNGAAALRSSTTGGGGHGAPAPLLTALIVKYIANSAAKNINSDDNQTMVPTATMFGRVGGPWPGVVSIATALATSDIVRSAPRQGDRPPDASDLSSLPRTYRAPTAHLPRTLRRDTYQAGGRPRGAGW